MASATNDKVDGSFYMNKCYENYVLIDVGANLTNKKFMRDLGSVISRAKDAGVQKIIVYSSSLKGSKEALRLTRLYPGTVYATAGVHPHEAKTWSDTSYEELKAIAISPECVAIGDCGLDYLKNFSPPDIQRTVFQRQIELACELRKPLFMHEKGAHEDFVSILEQRKDLPLMVLHSYAGTLKTTEKYLSLGMYFCITGFICKDNSEDGLQFMLTSGAIPLDRLLVQTDSPFMYPNARASKLPSAVKDSLTERSLSFLQRYCTFQRNEPCSLPAIVEIVAALLCKKPEEIALATAFNALKVFVMN